MRRPVTSLNSYVEWIAGRALPVWATLGFDTGNGRFRERLDQDGAPLDVPHRAMVQARQIYVYAHACQLGWFEDGGRLAETAMRSARRDFLSDDGIEASFAFSIDAGGGIVSDVRDSYTHAFMLFAIAWLYRLNGDRELLDLADRLSRYIDRHLFDPAAGGLYDAVPTPVRDKRQNPLMHLLEAYLAMERAAPERGYLERAAGLVELFAARLFSEEPGVLVEHFAEDWSPHPDPAKATLFEPGHHFEWVWLLDDYAELSGADITRWSDRLYDMARAHGLSPQGLVYDEVAADTTVVKRSHRVWPHTEGIKAAVARAARGDRDAPAFAGMMARGLLDTFLDRPFDGGWIDHIDEARQPLVSYVPASSLYHLFFAGAEAAKLSGGAGATGAIR